MRKYHVYAVGNALVDFDFEISDAFLCENSINKGVMTHIDEKRHQTILEKLNGTKHFKACGGSAANAVIAASQFGSMNYYACKIANDPSGNFYLKDLLSHNIHTNANHHNRDSGHTGKCIVMTTPDADRTMNTHLGIAHLLSPNEIDESIIADSQYAYIEGYLVAFSSGCATAKYVRRAAKEHNVKTTITLSDINMTEYYADALRAVIGDGVDFLFCNKNEALSFTKTGTIDNAREQLKRHARAFVITKGKHGSLLYDGDRFTDIPPAPAKPIDTVGAGDMFAGAMLYAISHNYSYEQAAHFANHASAKIVTLPGPRLSQEDCEELLKLLGPK